MDKKELARLINGREYGFEPFRDVRQIAKEAGLVIVTGASDDLMEFGGAIYDEQRCFDGGVIYFDRQGAFGSDGYATNMIEALWCNESALDENGNVIPWTYKTDIPNETFMIYENGQPYCRGIVFDLADVEIGVMDMEALKWLTTIWNVFMVIFILWFSRGMTWQREKAVMIGFGIMTVMYILALVPIWR